MSKLSINSKVGGGGLGALVATVMLWALSTYANVLPPPEVASAITGILAFAGGYVASNDRDRPDSGPRTNPNGHTANRSVSRHRELIP